MYTHMHTYKHNTTDLHPRDLPLVVGQHGRRDDAALDGALVLHARHHLVVLFCGGGVVVCVSVCTWGVRETGGR